MSINSNFIQLVILARFKLANKPTDYLEFFVNEIQDEKTKQIAERFIRDEKQINQEDENFLKNAICVAQG